MKTSTLYLNIILTILTVCLIGVLIQNQILIRELKTASNRNHFPSSFPSQQVHNRVDQFAIVPINEDGSINVNLTGSSETMDINIKQVNGYNIPNSQLPVKPEMTDVNILQIGGSRFSGGELPIKREITDVNIKQVGGSSIGSYVPIRN